jgi:hypothetical protein
MPNLAAELIALNVTAIVAASTVSAVAMPPQLLARADMAIE